METCGDDCVCDYLSVTVNDMTTRYCGTAPSQEVFQGPLTLRFSSDSSVTLSGFSFRYNVLNECKLKRKEVVEIIISLIKDYKIK